MRKFLLMTLSMCAAMAAQATELTATELRWLRAGWPVLTYAEQQGLDIDIVVQPATSAAAPFAMGFAEGRCQLVLSMRDNPDADAVLAGVPPELANQAIEAITAHEVAHCWRHKQGAWHQLPAGFITKAAEHSSDEQQAHIRRVMRETRIEEGFADLVGLAWTAQHHPEQYADVYGWLAKLRQQQPIDGSYHDTRRWVQMAPTRAAFDAGDTPFEQARRLWEVGLSRERALATH